MTQDDDQRSRMQDADNDKFEDFVEVNGLSLTEELHRASLMQSFDPHTEIDRLRLTWAIREAIEECEVEPESGSIVRNSSSCGEQCLVCKGHGQVTCRYCRGTGFLTIVDKVIAGGNDCPVCKGTGYEQCRACRGTGAIAKWQVQR